MMKVKKERIRQVNNCKESEGTIIYWMNRELRAEDNWALLYAFEKASEKKAELIVVYNLVLNYEGGGYRQNIFKLETLQEVEESLEQKNIPFELLVSKSSKESEQQLKHFFEAKQPGLIVTDFSPVRTQRRWLRSIAKLPFAVHLVDAHNIVPVWEASLKQEFAAYTFRPKIYRKISEYLEPFPNLSKYRYNQKKPRKVIKWKSLSASLKKDAVYQKQFAGGTKAGRKALQVFISKKLAGYAEKRNDACADGQSDLSPYLHYGVLAPARVALDVLERIKLPITKVIDSRKNKAKSEEKKKLSVADHAGAFLEELIVRRELSDNFCFYNKNYDSPAGFPDWAKKSLQAEEKTKRAFLYTKKEWEEGKTHDDLWNAAQMEMVRTGKMHGYMRMYWAKKILEWSKNPHDALKIAIYLNDKYELDGRDPNGYAGIAWSIGGVHDRAWFPRPVFGTVRYMAESGAKKKFDTKAYIAKWLERE